MSILSGAVIKFVLFFAILGVIVNDTAVIGINYWLTDDLAQSIARGTATAFRTSGGDKNFALATAYKLCSSSATEALSANQGTS